MAQCSSTPTATLFRTDTLTTSSLSESVYTTVETTTASAGSFTSTATLCATEVPVGSTCETTSTTTEIVMTTGGFSWTETHTSTSTITVPSTYTTQIPTSTLFTTHCNSDNPPNNPPTTTDPPQNQPTNPPNNNPPDTGGNTNSNPNSNSNTVSNPPTGSQSSGSNSLGTSPTSTGTIGPGRLNDDGGGSGGETAAARAGKTVGIVLGSVLGAAVLGTLIFWFWRRRVSRWNDIFDDSDDEGTGARAGRGWRAVGGAPMMLRHRRSKRKPRVDFDPVPGPYEYGLVGSAGTMSTPTAALGLVSAAAPAGIHQRTPSNNSQPDTPSSSLGPFVRSASATGFTHARPPSTPEGSFSLPPGAAAPLVDYVSTSHGSPTQSSTRPPLTPPPATQSRSGSPVSMDFGAIGATLPRPSSAFSASTAITPAGGARPGSILSPMEHDYGRIGIRPMSTASVSTVQTQRAGQQSANHQRGPSFGSTALAALDELVAGQVAGQHAPSPVSPRALKSAEPSSSSPPPTSPGGTVVVHRDAGPAPAEPPAYSR